MIRTRAFVVATVLAGFVTACHDPDTHLPAGPQAPAFASAEIVGPDSVAPGQTVQLSVNVRATDGTVKGIGAGAVRWRSNNLSTAQVSATGVVTGGGQLNEAVISADVTIGRTTRTASRSIYVMPAGTFRVVGSVLEAEPPSSPISGARVEVATGTPFATTDFNGQYKLYGVPAAATIHVLADGYQDQSRDLQLGGNSTQNFLMALNGDRLLLSGNYTLTFDVLSCDAFGPSLRSDLRHRSYDATLSQVGKTVTVKLTEPRFRLNSFGRGDGFTGTALVGGARFSLQYYDSYYYSYYGPSRYPNIAERLSDGTYLAIAADGVASGSPSGLSGAMGGSIVQWDSKFPNDFAGSPGHCYGTVQFQLTPR
jgi:hypothetical protein